jgi:lysophospholipase L1-like esterase
MLVALLVSGCGSDSRQSAPVAVGARSSAGGAPQAATTLPTRPVYVAVGASETVGVGADRPATEAWPTVLHGKAMRGTGYVNVGVSGSTVAQALVQQLPRALAERPRVATVWLNVNDILGGVSPEAYEADLRRLVHALRRDGATTVLVANTPRVEALPAYVACLPDPPPGARPCARPGIAPPPAVIRSLVARYNAAIQRVVTTEGAELVDLHAAATAFSGARLTAADGFHPSTAGHRAVAAAFAKILKTGA